VNSGYGLIITSEASGSGVSIADWTSIGLTFALVVITGIYVKHTSDMVKEMKNQRLTDVDNRRREKSDRAAYQCLDAVRYLADEMSRRGATAVPLEVLKITQRTLRGEG